MIYSDAISKRISHDRILWSVLYLFYDAARASLVAVFLYVLKPVTSKLHTQPIVCYSCFRFALVFLSFIVYFGYGFFFSIECVRMCIIR